MMKSPTTIKIASGNFDIEGIYHKQDIEQDIVELYGRVESEDMWLEHLYSMLFIDYDNTPELELIHTFFVTPDTFELKLMLGHDIVRIVKCYT